MEMSGLSMEGYDSKDLSLKGKEAPVKVWSVNLQE
jgi:hypothetical protein